MVRGAGHGIGSPLYLVVANMFYDPLKIVFHMKKESKEVVRGQD